MDERGLELKVGALVVLAVAGVLALLWLMGDLTFSKGAPLEVRFASTGNVISGAPVKYGGVTVGHVESIRLFPARRGKNGVPLPVSMTLGVDPDVRAALRTDASVHVATQGLLGESFLAIEPGSPGAPPLPENAALVGAQPVDLSQALAQVGPVLTSVNALATKLEAALGKNPQAISQLIERLSDAAEQLRQTASLFRAQLGPHGKLTQAINDAAATASTLHRAMPKLTSQAEKTLEGISRVTKPLSAEDGRHLKAALAAFASGSKQLDQVAGRIDRILADIQAGKGTLGKLQKDPKLYQDLDALVREIQAHPWKLLWKH